MARPRDSFAARVVPPLVTFAVLVAAWHFSVRWFGLSDTMFPPPLAVLEALKEGLVGGSLWPHIGVTLVEILVGYAAGCSFALLVAAAVSESEWLERAVYPVLIGIQSIPKVALAPILLVWLGFEMESKIVMVALICFFPTFVNGFAGFRSAEPDLLALYKAFGAGRWRTFRDVKLPAALGQIFSGLEISVVLALIGAIVAELVSARRGLGQVISASAANFNVATMFACVVILAAIGVGLSLLVRLARRKLVFWERSRASSGAASVL